MCCGLPSSSDSVKGNADLREFFVSMNISAIACGLGSVKTRPNLYEIEAMLLETLQNQRDAINAAGRHFRARCRAADLDTRRN